VFRRPDGTVVDPAAPPLPDDVTELPELHDRLGVEVDTAAPGGRWDGHQIDWGCFWAALLPPAAPGVADRKVGNWN
jgi:hypothetical protein